VIADKSSRVPDPSADKISESPVNPAEENEGAAIAIFAPLLAEIVTRLLVNYTPSPTAVKLPLLFAFTEPAICELLATLS